MVFRLPKPLVMAVALGGCQNITPGVIDLPLKKPVDEVHERFLRASFLLSDADETDSSKLPSSNLLEYASSNVKTGNKRNDKKGSEADLIAVMRDAFKLNLDQNNPRIHAALRRYSESQYYFDLILERAKPYLYHIVTEIKRRDLPMELALLPIVESAFDPFAQSGDQAMGLWQMTPSTGLYLGLTQNWWYDGRRDIIAATNTALDYLVRLKDRFDDWELGLAAYNAGPGYVSSMIRRSRQQGKPSNYWAMPLYRETSAYMPKLIALAKIFRNPGKYNITLHPIANRPYFEKVTLKAQIDLMQASALAGIDVDELYRLNPGFNRWSTSPDGPHHLLIPVERAAAFRKALAKLPANRRISWQRYTVRSGDTLLGLANRFGTKVATLRGMNDLKRSVIVAGRSLLVPVSGNARIERITPAGLAGQHKINHVVRSGDSFWDLARTYGVPVNQLALWNHMKPNDLLRVGQNLTVWAGASNRSPSKRLRKINYTVRHGDSLSRIAYKFGVSVQNLQKWNKLKKHNIYSGQHLTIYAKQGKRF